MTSMQPKQGQLQAEKRGPSPSPDPTEKKLNCYHLPIDAPSARLITHITISESHLDISKPLKTHLWHSFAMIWKRHETTSWSRNGFIVPCLSETLRRPPFASARHWLQFWLTVALHAANSEKPGLAGRSYLGLPCRNWKLRENGQQIQQMWIVQVFNPSWWKIVEWYCINRFNICITSIHWKSISNDNIKWLPYTSLRVIPLDAPLCSKACELTSTLPLTWNMNDLI